MNVILIILIIAAIVSMTLVIAQKRALDETGQGKDLTTSANFTIKDLEDDDTEMESSYDDIEDEDSAADAEFASLRSVGIEPRAGLRYCQNDVGLYRSLLAEYAYGEIEKGNNLQKSFDEENWHDYSIHVHSLKSSSKMIGATALSTRAAKLESAANSGDVAAIRTEHDSLMEEYEVVTAVIRSVVSKDELNSDENGVTEFSPDDDIMEFLPNQNGEE